MDFNIKKTLSKLKIHKDFVSIFILTLEEPVHWD